VLVLLRQRGLLLLLLGLAVGTPAVPQALHLLRWLLLDLHLLWRHQQLLM
jgi:hypothetical protein